MTDRDDSPGLSRRQFVNRTAAAVAWLAAGGVMSGGDGVARPMRPVVGFTKPFGKLPPRELAELAAEVGWDSIECAIRPGEQVEPARVADELPELLAALESVGRTLPLVVTDITSLDQPHAESVLRAVARAGLPRLRLGAWRYSLKRSPLDELPEVGAQLKDIAAACRDLGLRAGVQNHSSRRFVGASVWDLFHVIRDLDREHLGLCYDIGHGTVENGLAWAATVRAMEPWFVAVIVKDFRWQKQAQGWRPEWCPLGEGMVDDEFFAWLEATGYAGPVSQHYEYPLGDRAAAIATIRRDVRALRERLA